MGFADPARAGLLLADAAIDPEADEDLLATLANAADPDLALASLSRIPGAAGALRADDRLVAVLGVSAALGDHLVRHPEDLRVLQDPTPGTLVTLATVADLAAAYHRELLRLAALDLTRAITINQVGERLADLADSVLQAALAIARAEQPATARSRLAIVAMGKCGARELNYASDVDVIFVAEPADAAAERLAAAVVQICARSTPEGSIFPVDPNLRPEGRQGPLVRTLASHRAYYERWAKTWEFQALLKSRPAAGDAELGRDYAEALHPMVWEAARRERFVEDVQAMRRRVEQSLPKREAGRELKLGPGGLRDIEFAVQLLQLVHGGADESLRAPATLPALAALAAGGYVGRTDAADLAAAYRFLRRTEHLLQLHRLSRTHMLPEDPAVLRRLGRAFFHNDISASDPAGLFDQLWRKHARQVRRLHEKLFYRPLLDAVARLPSEEARLTPEAARARLEALGYVDPAGALRHIDALTSGVSRRAAIQRTLLPVLLGWFAGFAEPDAGLLAFRQVSDALGESPWYLRLLRDETKAAERMARVLASSRYAAGLLLRAPEAVAMFGDDAELLARTEPVLTAEMLAAARRHGDDAEAAVATVRSLRRRELLRIACADILGAARPGEGLAAVTGATLRAALAAAMGKVQGELRGPLPTRFAVIAMGRFGGHESGYGSDADVLFVHDPLPGADDKQASDAAHAVAVELRRLLALPVPDPPLLVDADLRPEGRQGPLVRTLAAYRAYYRRWSAPWEAQALLRAEPAAGDADLGAEFIAMADEFRYPAGGIKEAAVREIRRIKARVEGERIPRGVDPALHLKLGPGGLSDVEWTIQLLQLRRAHQVPGLRTTRTGPAIAAAVEADLLPAEAGRALTASWELASLIRNAIVLVTGRPADTLPTRRTEAIAVGRLLGYPPQEAAQALEQDYRRAARRARAAMEHLFYG
jgi:glutamate-ammonia-ligase adenylyltransferase